MLHKVRKYKKWLVGLSLAILVLPLFSIFCQSCLDGSMSKHSNSSHASHNIEDTDHSCCKQVAVDSPSITGVAGECCESEVSDSNTSEIVLIFSDTQTEKFILVSQVSQRFSSWKGQYRSNTFTSLKFAHAKLFFRNPVLLN